MAAYLTVQINTSGMSVGDMNAVLCGGDSTKPHEVVESIVNLLTGIDGGARAGAITAVSSTVAGTVSGQTGGVSVSLNLT